MKYRIKGQPDVVVEAAQVPDVDDSAEPFVRWAEEMGLYAHGWEWSESNGGIWLGTAPMPYKDRALLVPGDWLIKDADGSFRPVRKEFFDVFYYKDDSPPLALRRRGA